MRFFLTLLLIVAFLASPALGIYFHYDAGTSGNFTKLTQTFNIDHGNKTGLFIASQFAFHKGAAGYFGLQPKQDKGGAALFSYFGKNATASHPNCKGGADGSSNGVTCLMYFDWVEGRNYTIDAEYMSTNANGTNTWEGRIWDDVEHTSRIIGRWSMPASNGLFSRAITGFLEWYTQNGHNTKPEDRDPCMPKLGYSVYTPIYFRGQKSQRGVLNSHTDGGMQDSCSFKKNELTAVFTQLTNGVHVDVGRLTPNKDGYYYE